MPTHLEDIHLIIEIQDQIHTIISQHPNHQTIMARDFNRDILLKGRTTNGISIPPNSSDQEWAHFTQNNGLKVIQNPMAFTRQRGYNYTSTSHIDCFFSNAPNTTNLQSHTLTNLNQNSDHYPVQLQLALNTIVIKDIPTPQTTRESNTPLSPRTWNPVCCQALSGNLTYSAHWDRHRHAIKVWISSTVRYARRTANLDYCGCIISCDLTIKLVRFWVIANLCSASVSLHWSDWDRCSFCKLKFGWFRSWSQKIFLSYFWTRGCVMWRSICVTGNPNWWVWMESLLCSWKWFGCSLSNLLVLVDGLHNWY